MKRLFVILTIICAGALARADQPTTHGMALFGDQQTYVSHLPMFHAPHDYQVILKIKMKNIARSMTLDFFQWEKEKGQTLFTIAPEKMDLTKVIDGTIKEFQAILYSGHFERGGKKLGWVQVIIEKNIYSQKLNPEKLGATANYIVFGENGEYFAAHLINGIGSFDSILQISELSQAGPFCTRRDCSYEGYIKPDSELPYQMLSKIDEPFGDVGTLKDWSWKAVILKNIYTEIDELGH